MKAWPLHRFIYMLGLLAAASPWAVADENNNAFDEWRIDGSNTLRMESYGSEGNRLGGPYQNTGTQGYDELNLDLSRRFSAYEIWRAQIYGVVNGSDYRLPQRGVEPERVNFTMEKGDARIPFRLEAGDFFGYFSYRTLQRSLKGAQLELQPVTGGAWRHSIQLLAGTNQPSWTELDYGDDRTAGASWLLEQPGTRINFNVLNNSRQGNTAAGTLDRSQNIFSVALDQDWMPTTQRLKFEGEFAQLTGDHDGITTVASGQSRSGNGVFAQLSGRPLTLPPLNYRFRYERYDQDFRPAGGVVSADRRSVEAHAGWRFDNSMSLRGRIQYFTDGFQSGNETDTRTTGISFSGPLFYVPDLNGSIDVFRQETENRTRTIDRHLVNLNAFASRPLSGGWIGEFGLFAQNLSDFVAGAISPRTRQYRFGATHALTLGEFSGSITPGIAYRTLSHGSNLKEWNPTLALALGQGPHSVAMSYGLLTQDFTAATPDVVVSNFGANYTYTTGDHLYGADFNLFDRSLSPGTYTTQYRASLFWQYNFERLPASTRAARVALVSDAVGEGSALPRSPALLLSAAPGIELAPLLQRLEASGFGSGVRQPGAVVYEARLLDEIDQRQRFALLHDAGMLTKSALVIDFDNVGDRQSSAQLYERVRKALLDRFGKPLASFENGNFGPNLVADLTAGRFIRVMEWQTENGRLRLGIPRRLDGTVRIEVQHAKSFSAPRDTLWSAEAVR